MTIEDILKTRPYIRWHDGSEFQLSSYSKLEHLLNGAFKIDIYVPEEWVDPLRGYVLVTGLDVFIEQGNQHFAYRII